MTADIDRYVRNCHLCRRSDVPRDKTPGLLQPLPVPIRTWTDLSMDFHEPGTSDKHGNNNILVIVDRLSKRYVSLPTKKTATAKTAADLYYRYIWRFRGAPVTITSDRGPQFISSFTDEIAKRAGVKIKLSTSEHSQTNGQTEIINQIIDQRLRPFVNHFQDNWSELLPALEAAHAAIPHASTGLSPHMVDYGYEPRLDFDWRDAEYKPKTVREKLSRDEAKAQTHRIQEAVEWARKQMAKSQEEMRTFANRKRREPDFDVGSKVFVTKKTWRTDRPSDKLDFPLAGPFQIVSKEGHSYKLDLPKSYRINPVLHADRLRLDTDDPLPGQYNEPEPPTEVNGELEWEVERILSSRIYHRRLQYQVEWRGWDSDNTWYNASNFKNAPLRLKSYHEQYPSQPGPPIRLQEWLDASSTDEAMEEHVDDDLPEGDQEKAGQHNKRRRRK